MLFFKFISVVCYVALFEKKLNKPGCKSKFYKLFVLNYGRNYVTVERVERDITKCFSFENFKGHYLSPVAWYFKINAEQGENSPLLPFSAIL